jgi:hypothetical protein
MATVAIQLSLMQIDAYILDTLMPDLVGHDRKPSAFIFFLFLWAATAGGERTVEASLTRIAAGTGGSRRGVQDALDRLASRELISVERDGIAAVARYTVHAPWRRYRDH